MTKFADQLYADLMREHGSALAGTRPPAGPRRQSASRRALLATGAGGLAVAATAAALTVGDGTPAYALTTSHNGTVRLAVYQTAGIPQANARLRQLGDNVVVVPVRSGCPAISSLPAPAVPPDGKGKISVQSARSKDGPISVNAHGVPAGDILVVAAEITAHGTQMAASLTSPPAPGCVSMPPPPDRPGANVAHSSGPGPKAARRGSGGNVVQRTGSGPDVSRS